MFLFLSGSRKFKKEVLGWGIIGLGGSSGVHSFLGYFS